MFRRIGLVPIMAAAAFALVGCEPGPVVPTNNTAETNYSQSGGAPTGGVCDGIGNIQCASDKDFCKLPEGQCDVPDAQGTCTTKEEICPRDFKPVCGCDGKTYGNSCTADQAGVSVQSQGECPKPEGEKAANTAAE